MSTKDPPGPRVNPTCCLRRPQSHTSRTLLRLRGHLLPECPRSGIRTLMDSTSPGRLSSLDGFPWLSRPGQSWCCLGHRRSSPRQSHRRIDPCRPAPVESTDQLRHVLRTLLRLRFGESARGVAVIVISCSFVCVCVCVNYTAICSNCQPKTLQGPGLIQSAACVGFKAILLEHCCGCAGTCFQSVHVLASEL